MKYLKTTIPLLMIIALFFDWSFVLSGGKTTSDVTDLERDNSPEYWGRTDDVNLDLLGDVTISVWINAESWAGVGAGWNSIVAKGTHATGYDLHGLTEDGNRFRVYQNATEMLVHTVTLPTATWIHLAYTCDDVGGAGSAQFYYNGTGTTSGTCTLNNNNLLDFRIGSNNDATNRNFDGLIADVRIWARILTATEITNLRVTPCTFDNGNALKGQWLFDEGTGTSAADQSTSTATLTGVNTPAWLSSAPYTACVAGGGAAPEVPQIIWFE